MTRNRYHAPNVPPVTAWARHLDAVARAEGLSQSGLFRKLREAVALGPESRSAFLPYLVDKEPDADQARALAAIVGWPTEPGPDRTPAAPPDRTFLGRLRHRDLLGDRTLETPKSPARRQGRRRSNVREVLARSACPGGERLHGGRGSSVAQPDADC